jgi:hypothetical protein
MGTGAKGLTCRSSFHHPPQLPRAACHRPRRSGGSATFANFESNSHKMAISSMCRRGTALPACTGKWRSVCRAGPGRVEGGLQAQEDFLAADGCTFESLGLDPRLAAALEAAGFRRPALVQVTAAHAWTALCHCAHQCHECWRRPRGKTHALLPAATTPPGALRAPLARRQGRRAGRGDWQRQDHSISGAHHLPAPVEERPGGRQHAKVTSRAPCSAGLDRLDAALVSCVQYQPPCSIQA